MSRKHEEAQQGSVNDLHQKKAGGEAVCRGDPSMENDVKMTVVLKLGQNTTDGGEESTFDPSRDPKIPNTPVEGAVDDNVPKEA